MPYPTPPGPRIAYDQDGSLAFFKSNYGEGGVHELTPSFLRLMNTDGSNVAGLRFPLWWAWNGYSNTDPDYNSVPYDAWIAIRFPVAMRIRAATSAMWWIGGTYIVDRLIFDIETSSDSSNGQDGTWTTLLHRGENDDFGGFTGNPDQPPDFPIVYPDNWNQGQVYVPAGYAPFFVSQASYPLAETPLPTAASPEFGPTPNPSSRNLHLEKVFPNRRRQNDPDGVGWRHTPGTAGRQVMWLRMRVVGKGARIYSYYSDYQIPQFKLHLYGEPDTTADSKRLSFVTTAGAAKPFFDFGEINAKHGAYTQQFRLKNESSTLTAGTVKARILAPNPTLSTTDAPDSWCKLSTDGVSWANEVTFTSLAPGATSDIITMRVIPQPGIMGPWAPRMQATVGGWS